MSKIYLTNAIIFVIFTIFNFLFCEYYLTVLRLYEKKLFFNYSFLRNFLKSCLVYLNGNRLLLHTIMKENNFWKFVYKNVDDLINNLRRLSV